MLENIKLIDRPLWIKAMRNLFFIIPVFLITNSLYIARYGEYEITWDFEYALNYLFSETGKCLFAGGVFCAIFAGAYFFERDILPNLFFHIGRIKRANVRVGKMKAGVFLKKRLGYNPLSHISELTPLEVYQIFTFIPVSAILWMIWFNTWWSYLSIVIIFIYMIVFYRVLNSIYYEQEVASNISEN